MSAGLGGLLSGATSSSPDGAHALIERALAGAWRPARPHIADARRAIGAALSSFTTWRALFECDVLPPSWEPDGSRAFAVAGGRLFGVLRGDEPAEGVRVVERVAGDRVFVPAFALSSDLVTGDVVDCCARDAFLFNELAPAARAARLVGSIAPTCAPPSHDYESSFVPSPDGTLALALAADRDHLGLVEALAGEAVERLAPWGIGPVAQVAWADAERLPGRVRCGLSHFDLLYNSLDASCGGMTDEESAILTRWGSRRGSQPHLLCHAWLAFGCARWRRLADRGEWVFWDSILRWHGAEERPTAPLAHGTRFCDLLNPFVPLLEICALGYLPEIFWGASSLWVFVPTHLPLEEGP